MKANELRIGNWVKSNVQVGESWDVVVNENDFSGNYIVFDPIPLTEEWLIKFGFEKTISDEFYHSKEELFGISCAGWSHIWDASFTGAPCKYVHQVQNLFFALTNQELTIK